MSRETIARGCQWLAQQHQYKDKAHSHSRILPRQIAHIIFQRRCARAQAARHGSGCKGDLDAEGPQFHAPAIVANARGVMERLRHGSARGSGAACVQFVFARILCACFEHRRHASFAAELARMYLQGTPSITRTFLCVRFLASPCRRPGQARCIVGGFRTLCVLKQRKNSESHVSAGDKSKSYS